MTEFAENQPVNKLEIPETTTIKPVVERLRSITFEQVKDFLDQKKEDAKAGIGVINLTELGIAESVEMGELKYQFYIAYVPPNGHVKAHYHEKGPEPYRFMFADTGGEMNLAPFKDGKVGEYKTNKVNQGSEVEVAEREVHTFYNTTDRPVFFLFACPAVHLKDYNEVEGPNQGPDGDRYIVEGKLEGAIPPQHRNEI